MKHPQQHAEGPGRLRSIAARLFGRETASAMIEYTLVALAVGIAAVAGVQALTGGIGDAVELHQDSVLESSSGGDGGGSDPTVTTGTEAPPTTETPPTTESPPTTCVSKGSKTFCG